MNHPDRVEPVPGAPGGGRILRLFSRLNVGGPSVHVILLSAGLRPRGYETRLVVGREAPREGNLLDLAAAKEVVCERLTGLGREIRPFADVAALARLYRLTRAYRPHVVHTHTAKAGVLGRTAARLAGVPVVVHTFHGHVLREYFSPLAAGVFRGLERGLGGVSDGLVAVSAAVKQDLVELGVARAEKIRVIPLGLELLPLAGELSRGVLRQEAGFPAEAPLVGIVGRLVPVKDVTTFLRAAARVRESLPEARFAVVGDGELRAELEAEVLRLGLGGSLRFFGWRRDLAAVFGDLDLVVNSSLNEGTPVALIEALAAGRPVVATRVGGTPDLLGDGKHGALVPARDAEALAAAIVAALGNPERAREQARLGQAHVLREHAVERLVDDVDGFYRELMAARGVLGAPTIGRA